MKKIKRKYLCISRITLIGLNFLSFHAFLSNSFYLLCLGRRGTEVKNGDICTISCFSESKAGSWGWYPYLVQYEHWNCFFLQESKSSQWFNVMLKVLVFYISTLIIYFGWALFAQKLFACIINIFFNFSNYFLSHIHHITKCAAIIILNNISNKYTHIYMKFLTCLTI